jgi:nucleoside 2-deoxyribosyltransferase
MAIIAVLTGANPNVYLEVGYAWGKGRPTILITDDAEAPRFDLRGQRYLKYRRIKDVEETLTRELRILLKHDGRI